MAREKMNSAFAVGLFFLLLGSIFNIVGVFTRGWLTGFGLIMGIFEMCPTVGDDCRHVNYGTDSIAIVRGTTIAGIVLSLLALLLFLMFLGMTCRGRTPSHKIAVAGGIFAFIAGGCIGSGILVFVITVYNAPTLGYAAYLALNLGYSFILCVVGAVFIFGGGVVGWLGARKQVIARNPPQAFVLTVPYISQTQTGVVMQGQQVFYQCQPNQNMYAMPTYPAGQFPAQPLDPSPSYTPSQYSTPATNQGFQQLQAPPLYAPRERKQVPLN